MTLSAHSNPYGYKDLLVYKKAEELQLACAALTGRFPSYANPKGEMGIMGGSTPAQVSLKTLSSLQDQMDRSARSVKQNIVEGWKRNSTKEYYEFLGFSLGANAELEEDCNDLIKGVYDGMGLKGLKGERKSEREVRGTKGERGLNQTPLNPSTSSSLSTPSTPSTPSVPLTLSPHLTLKEVERLPFYPLDAHLPLLVQLKLRCKELNLLLERLQKSLLAKMESERTLPVAVLINRKLQKEAQDDQWLAQEIERVKREAKGE